MTSVYQCVVSVFSNSLHRYRFSVDISKYVYFVATVLLFILHLVTSLMYISLQLYCHLYYIW